MKSSKLTPVPAGSKDAIYILIIFQYVYAGLETLVALSMLGLFLVYSRIDELMRSLPPNSTYKDRAPYGLLAFMLVVFAIKALVNALSATWMKRRKCRVLSLVFAGFNCLQIPFGLILAVCTFIILNNPRVIAEYRANKKS